MEKCVPVVVIKEMSETDKILTALKKHGINTAEITFRTACAAEAIAMRKWIIQELKPVGSSGLFCKRSATIWVVTSTRRGIF